MIWYNYPAIMATVKAHFPGHPVHVLGHSLGRRLAEPYAAMREGDMDSVILIAAGSVHYKRFSLLDRYGILLGTQAARAMSRILGTFPGKRFGCGLYRPIAWRP